MKNLFEINLEERNRILEMHTKATKKNYLNEQPEPENWYDEELPKISKPEPKIGIPEKLDDSEVQELTKAITHLRDRVKELRRARREESIEILFNNTKRVLLTALNNILERIDKIKLSMRYNKDARFFEKLDKEAQKLEEAKRKLEESQKPATLEDLEKMKKDILKEIGNALLGFTAQLIFFTSQKGKEFLQNIGLIIKSGL